MENPTTLGNPGIRTRILKFVAQCHTITPKRTLTEKEKIVIYKQLASGAACRRTGYVSDLFAR